MSKVDQYAEDADGGEDDPDEQVIRLGQGPTVEPVRPHDYAH